MRSSIIIFSICFPLWIFAQNFVNVAPTQGIIEYANHTGNSGCGISFCDFDGDGDDDLTFGTGESDSIYFYQNNNGTFQKIFSPVDYKDHTKQILWVDYNNDGDKDLFVATFDGRNKLFDNNGSFEFTDTTTSVGLPSISDPTSGANFGDYDNDGWLDLYITNFADLGSSYTNYMFKNNNGIFTNETFSTGTANGIVIDFVSVFFDFNDDGFDDIYTCADRVNNQNKLLKNNGDGTFTDVSASSNTDLLIDAMNCGVGDIENDGDLDLYVTNTPFVGNVMLQNNGDDTFTDVTTSSGTAFNRLGWAGNFFDYDIDGDLDIYVSSSEIGEGKHNALYVNDGNGVFTEPLINGFPGDTFPSYSNVIGDFNNDGMLDIAVSNNDTFRFQLWENLDTNSNNYIKFQLEGQTCNRDAYGTKIEIYINGNKFIRSTHCGQGYLGQNSDKVHFGLGTASTIDSVLFKWPGGNIDKLYNVSANQTLTVQEGNLGPLPVELVSFLGREQNPNIELQWISYAEVDFKGYEIERSESGLTYEKIGFVPGENKNYNNYTFTDEQIEKGKRYYYRLKMIDLNGEFKYSKVVVVEVKSDEFQIHKIFPNPAQKILNVDILAKKNEAGSATIFNATGQIVLEKKINLNAGENSITFDMEELENGIYFITFDFNFPSQRIPFLIQKE